MVKDKNIIFKNEIEPIIISIRHLDGDGLFTSKIIEIKKRLSSPLKYSMVRNIRVDREKEKISTSHLIFNDKNYAVFFLVQWRTLFMEVVSKFMYSVIEQIIQNLDSRYYIIVADEMYLGERGRQESNLNFESDARNISLPCFPCRINRGIKSQSPKRCLELISEILGYNDKDIKLFPDYNKNYIWKISEKINREVMKEIGE